MKVIAFTTRENFSSLSYKKYLWFFFICSRMDGKFPHYNLQNFLSTDNFEFLGWVFWALYAPIFIILEYCSTAISFFFVLMNNLYQLVLTHGQALLLDSDLAPLFQFKRTSWGLLLGTQITPRGWIFWTMIFYNLKKFTSRSI